MSGNVFDIAHYRSPSLRIKRSQVASATIVALPTAEERKLANKIEAGRRFAAAETIAEMDAKATRPLEIMLRLSVDPDAGEYREKAATWLWRNCHTNVIGEDGEPVSKALRRFLAR